jgi:hypothetical protein
MALAVAALTREQVNYAQATRVIQATEREAYAWVGGMELTLVERLTRPGRPGILCMCCC